MPATNAPQLNVPMSFGIDMNLHFSQYLMNSLHLKQLTVSLVFMVKWWSNLNLLTRSSFSLIMYSSSCSVPFSSESATYGMFVKGRVRIQKQAYPWKTQTLRNHPSPFQTAPSTRCCGRKIEFPVTVSLFGFPETMISIKQ